MPSSDIKRTVTRNYSNEKNVEASKFPSSGFSLSYQNYYDGIIGRMIPHSVQMLLPHDKYQGSNSGAITLEQIVTPNAPQLQVHQYNFATRFRAVDSSFEELMTPTKLNNFSSGASLPIFVPSNVVNSVINAYSFGLVDQGSQAVSSLDFAFRVFKAAVAPDSATAADILDNLYVGASSNKITTAAGWLEFCDYIREGNCFAGIIAQQKESYCDDVMDDLLDWFAAYTDKDFATASEEGNIVVLAQTIRTMLLKFIGMFVGEGSIMDFLGYPIINSRTVRNLGVNNFTGTSQDLAFLLLYGDVKANCNELPCNELFLRTALLCWITYFRNIHLEPLNATLRWRKWGNASFLAAGANTPGFWALLTMRALPWAQDCVTSAMIDDVSEHVYAPVTTAVNPVTTTNQMGNILSGTYNTNTGLIQPASSTGTSSSTYQQYMVHSALQTLNLNYFDHSTNSNVSIATVIPSSIGRFMSLANVGTETNLRSLGLDLRTLRTAGMLEKYLHRKFYFGDLYSDELLAYWSTQVSDADLMMPKLLSGGVQILEANQQVSNTGTETTEQGARRATMSGDLPADPYADFSEEFGCVLGFMYVAPTVNYDPLLKQNLYRSYTDFPNPCFAQDNESIMYNIEFSRSQAKAMTPWGHVPYSNENRTRLNSVHGKFIDSYADWNINRFWGSDADEVPKLDYHMLHMSGMRLGCFANNVLLDGQFYVLASHQFNVERMLPSPVEYC